MAEALRKVAVRYDGLLELYTGIGRRTKVWKPKRVAWSALLARLTRTKRTGEKQSEFLRMSKTRQDEIKDVGGFVGGVLKDGRRTAMTTGERQLVTLDMDYAPKDFWEERVELFADYAICAYSTHKHSPDKPRLRLVLPLDRPVTPDEYQAIARKIAESFGMDYFDDTTYQPHRLMYWPSTSADAEFFCKWVDAPWLSADKVLAEYDDWQDQASWPTSSRQGEVIGHALKKQEDPCEKKGLIGVFCRAYTISEAIDKFLPGVYEKTAGKEGRYTFVAGSTAGGAVLYEDKWLYSHHSTDPCSMQLVNAFDLVRVHRFGDLDEGRGGEPSKLPSWEKMMHIVEEDERVRVLQMQERMDEARAEFPDLGEDKEGEDFSWSAKLRHSEKTGKLLVTRSNIRIILDNDPRLKGVLGFDGFSQRVAILRPPPWQEEEEKRDYWQDVDDSELRYYMETLYGIDSKIKLEDETLSAAHRHSFHRVREYLKGLKWDGTPRMDALFIDYLGAEDTEYTRMVTRKMLIAAVGRVMRPGLKFDNMVVLEGRQGIGKSYLLKKLGRDWFSDSLDSVQGKEAYEQLRGVWIVEMGELAALRKSEIEPIKQFISKQTDLYRVAYGKRLSEFPRQCIFIGTTNQATFLRDQTGNRRFWPVKCLVGERKKSLWGEDIDEEIDQVWAEALAAWDAGEGVWIGEEMERKAREVQEAHTEDNPYVGIIAEFLERELPENWYSLDIVTRRDFIAGRMEIDLGEKPIKRKKICLPEVWCELLGKDMGRFSAQDKKTIGEALEQVEGWKLYDGNAKHLLWFGNFYGRQKAYTRLDES